MALNGLIKRRKDEEDFSRKEVSPGIFDDVWMYKLLTSGAGKSCIVICKLKLIQGITHGTTTEQPYILCVSAYPSS